MIRNECVVDSEELYERISTGISISSHINDKESLIILSSWIFEIVVLRVSSFESKLGWTGLEAGFPCMGVVTLSLDVRDDYYKDIFYMKL